MVAVCAHRWVYEFNRSQKNRIAIAGRGFMKTLGYHIVISGYGLWLPGDDRGHWSEAWDEQIGFIEPHKLHAGDPIRERMAAERMTAPPVRLSSAMIDFVVTTLGICVEKSDWEITAASIEPTHTHLQMTYSKRDVDDTVKWLKDQLTKSVHHAELHDGPVWCKGKWRSYIFAQDVWDNTRAYIQRHNERRGVGPRPYPFLT